MRLCNVIESKSIIALSLEKKVLYLVCARIRHGVHIHEGLLIKSLLCGFVKVLAMKIVQKLIVLRCCRCEI